MSLSHFSQTSSSLKEAWPIKMVQQLGSSQNGSSSTSFPCSLLCLQQPFMPSVVHSCKNALHSQKLFLNSLENWLILLFEILLTVLGLNVPFQIAIKGGLRFLWRGNKNLISLRILIWGLTFDMGGSICSYLFLFLLIRFAYPFHDGKPRGFRVKMSN